MALKCRTSKQEIFQELVKQMERVESDLVLIMKYVGEEFVKDARENLQIEESLFPKGDYSDRTSNLRSSIGYFVLKDMQVLSFDVTGTAEGQKAAKEAMKTGIKKGLQLIVVAGMDYASYVESKGYNVITSQADMAVINLEKAWKKYAEKRKLFN